MKKIFIGIGIVLALLIIVIVLIVTVFVLPNRNTIIREDPALLRQAPNVIDNTTTNLKEDQNNTNNTTMQKTYNTPPSMVIDPQGFYIAVMHTTEGDITLELDAQAMPKTVNNFVFLAQEKFYDNTIFHRVMKGFMIQGGDPKGDGTGGPGYRFDDEPFSGEYTRGTIAMANAGPNTNGSQFFIMHEDYPLPPNYVIFGKVHEGMKVVDTIAAAPVDRSITGEVSQPQQPVTVTSIEIRNINDEIQPEPITAQSPGE